jgi:hypothetical protein
MPRQFQLIAAVLIALGLATCGVPKPAAPPAELVGHELAKVIPPLPDLPARAPFGGGSATTDPAPEITVTLADPKSAVRDLARTLGWFSRWLMVLSVLSLVASFFIPIIPRKGVLQGMAVAAGLGWGQYVVLKYGVVGFEVAFWLSVLALVGVVVATAGPLFVAAKRWALLKTSRQLATKGHLDAAVAMEAEAAPGKLPTREARQARLKYLQFLETNPSAVMNRLNRTE